MRSTRTIFRWLLPALLLTNFALTSCGCKDHDPKPRKCGNTTDGSTKPGGNS